jgi:hypothetical protein
MRDGIVPREAGCGFPTEKGMNDAPYNSALADNDFKIVRDVDLEWVASDAGLPPGVRTKRFMFDAAMKRRTSKVLFPPGYIEPRHTHLGWHNVLVLEGRMCVAGTELRSGDFVFGWDLPHGPFEYPDGCQVFAVSMGESMHHEWEWEPFLSYRRQWQPETARGREACVEFDRWRTEMAKQRGLPGPDLD